MNDSVFRPGSIYHPQVFLEECENVVKEKKVPIDDKEISSDSDKENFDEEKLSIESVYCCIWII